MLDPKKVLELVCLGQSAVLSDANDYNKLSPSDLKQLSQLGITPTGQHYRYGLVSFKQTKTARTIAISPVVSSLKTNLLQAYSNPLHHTSHKFLKLNKAYHDLRGEILKSTRYDVQLHQRLEDILYAVGKLLMVSDVTEWYCYESSTRVFIHVGLYSLSLVHN